MLTVLLLIIFAIIDFGRLLFAVQAMKAASREGARAAVVVNSTGQSVFDAAENAGASGAALAGGGNLTVIATPGGALPGTELTHAATFCAGTGGTPFELNVSAPFSWFTPVSFFAQSVNKVEATTVMRCE